MKKKKLIWQIPFLLILIIGSIFVIRQQRNTPFQKDEGMVFGTIYHIPYQSNTNYQKEIEAELQKVDNSLSPFNKTSIISRITAEVPGWITCRLHTGWLCCSTVPSGARMSDTR